jgi:hypothetical protein
LLRGTSGLADPLSSELGTCKTCKRHIKNRGHADAEARRSVLTALPCATLVTEWIGRPTVERTRHM